MPISSFITFIYTVFISFITIIYKASKPIMPISSFTTFIYKALKPIMPSSSFVIYIQFVTPIKSISKLYKNYIYTPLNPNMAISSFEHLYIQLLNLTSLLIYISLLYVLFFNLKPYC